MLKKLSLSIVVLFFLNLSLNADSENFKKSPESENIYKSSKLSPCENSFCLEENKGQLHDQEMRPRQDILFWGKSNGSSVFITKQGISYQFIRIKKDMPVEEENFADNQSGNSEPIVTETDFYRVDIKWMDANEKIDVETGTPSDEYLNYYNADYEGSPVLDVHKYEWVILKNVYDGIDLKYYSQSGLLKYDWIIRDPGQIDKIRYKVEGAEIEKMPGEIIVLKTPFGDIQDGKLTCTQNNELIDANWKVDDDIISLEINNYQNDLPIIVDPLVRIWGSYYGGSGSDWGYSLAKTLGGCFFMGGTTSSGNLIATSGAHQISFGGGSNDAFLVKFNQNGTREWGTYYGGTGNESFIKITADSLGNVYLSGLSASAIMIATPGAFQTTLSGAGDAFLAKFNENGIRQWGTYYGSFWSNEPAESCAADALGNVYLVGDTYASSGFATAGAYQTSNSGGNEGFIVKFDTNGARLWGTYFGGSDNERIYDCATNDNGFLVITGGTWSLAGIASPGANQAIMNGGGDGFVALFSPSGTRIWGSYCGGNYGDFLYSCDISADSSIIVFGNTYSDTLIATPGAYQETHWGSFDAFMVKYDFQGNKLWGSYYGGNGDDRGEECSFDQFGNILITGYTSSGTNIASSNGFQLSYQGNKDAYFAMFDTNNERIFGSYYGGSGDDRGEDIIVDDNQNIYITGKTSSTTSISTPPSHQVNYSGNVDGMLAKFRLCELANLNLSNDTVLCEGETFYLATESNPTYTFQWMFNDSIIISTNDTIIPITSGSYSVIVSDTNNCEDTSPIVTIDFFDPPAVNISYDGDSIFCEGDGINLCGSTGNMFSAQWLLNDTVIPNATDSCYFAVEGGWYSLWAGFEYNCSDTSNPVFLEELPFIQLNGIDGDSLEIIPGNLYPYQVPYYAGANYLWEITNGVITQGQGTNIVTVIWDSSPYGLLKVVADNLACNDSTELEVAKYLHIDNRDLDQLVRIYPNPFSEKISIHSSSLAKMQGKLTTVCGDVVSSFDIYPGNQIFDFKKLPSGIYMLIIITEEFNTSYRLIKIP